MTDPDPIFAAIGEFQARQAVACHAPGAQAEAAQARADAAILATRATTPDGLHAGMCFRLEAVTLHLHESDHEAAGLMWPVLGLAARRRPVSQALCALAAALEPGFYTDLLRAALCDALELEQSEAPVAQENHDDRRRLRLTA
jgi:hypothetical protein